MDEAADRSLPSLWNLQTLPPGGFPTGGALVKMWGENTTQQLGPWCDFSKNQFDSRILVKTIIGDPKPVKPGQKSALRSSCSLGVALWARSPLLKSAEAWRAVTASTRLRKPHRFRSLCGRLPSLFFQLSHLYLRILCASILRFWLLEHTTATRSGWLGIATLRLKLTDMNSKPNWGCYFYLYERNKQ